MAAEIDIDMFRETLLQEQKRLHEKQRHIELRSSSANETDENSELADYDDNHPGDAGSETESRTMDLALDENIDFMLTRIADALHKLDAGTYGSCDRCGGPINPERLRAIPYATLCIDCQDKVEDMG
jgi:RNA polymerase-binding protein DksA